MLAHIIATALAIVPMTTSSLSAHVAGAQDAEQNEGATRQADRAAQDHEREAAPAQAIGHVGPLLWSEGAALVRATGRLQQEQQGRWLLAIEGVNSGREPVTLVLLPSQALERMTRSHADSSGESSFEVTGSIHIFDHEVFLLPQSVRLANAGEADSVAVHDSEESGGVAEEPREPVDVGELSIEEIIAGVERDVPAAQSLPPAREGESAPPANVEAAAVYDDGEILMSRRGWVSRTAAGEWRFNFAADASGMNDTPMTLLPSETLASIRARVQASQPDQALTLTGRVYRFEGRAYLLPTMFRFEDAERNPNLRGG